MTPDRPHIVRQVALWGGAALLVLALHVAAAMAAMRFADPTPPPGLPEAVEIELAPTPAPAAQQVAAAQPAPEPAPEPQREPEPQPEPELQPEPEPAIQLPPLPQLAPVPDMSDLFPPPLPDVPVPSDLALNTSPRPQQRPQRQPDPEPQQQRRAEPQRQRQTDPEPTPRRQTTAQESARQQQRPSASQAAPGPSAAQLAGIQGQWQAVITNCIRSQASIAPDGLTGRVGLKVVIARNGRFQSVAVSRSSGDRGLDRAVARAARLVRRCPAAPATLTQPSYPFDIPITITE